MAKGQQQAVSAVLITGILIGVVASVYFWGVPIIQKSQERHTLQTAEDLMVGMNSKIKTIANSGGKDSIAIDVPAIVRFDGRILSLTMKTKGTIYSSGAWLSLTRSGCDASMPGLWGSDPPEVLCVKSEPLGAVSYETTFSLSYRELQQPEKSYKIELSGSVQSGGSGHKLLVEKTGVVEEGNLIKNVIDIKIV